MVINNNSDIKRIKSLLKKNKVSYKITNTSFYLKETNIVKRDSFFSRFFSFLRFSF